MKCLDLQDEKFKLYGGEFYNEGSAIRIQLKACDKTKRASCTKSKKEAEQYLEQNKLFTAFIYNDHNYKISLYGNETIESKSMLRSYAIKPNEPSQMNWQIHYG